MTKCASTQTGRAHASKDVPIKQVCLAPLNERRMTLLNTPPKNESPYATGASEPPYEPAPNPIPKPAPRPAPEPLSDPTPDPIIAQAKRDLDAGLVDTDMHATPGLDAQRRRQLVPGPGGKNRTQGG